MLSKWKIWDYIKSGESIVLPKGVYALSCFDSFFNPMIKSYLTGQVDVTTLAASDISTSWIDSNFRSLGLFGNNESFCINNSEILSVSAKEAFLEDGLMLEDRYLFFIFDKNDDFFNKLSKLDYVNAIKIEGPAFWETDKLLDFIADRKNVNLSFGSKQKILEYVEPTVSELSNTVNKLLINFGDESISEVMLDSILEKSKIDNFEMANLFGFKNMTRFYKKIIEVEPEFESLRSLFYFLQTHMSKVSDPRFIEKKSKASKYDKQILAQADVWKKGELLLVMEFLRELEFKAKTKNNFLNHDIRSAYYRSLI